jgi:hypothetical protein
MSEIRLVTAIITLAASLLSFVIRSKKNGREKLPAVS